MVRDKQGIGKVFACRRSSSVRVEWKINYFAKKYSSFASALIKEFKRHYQGCTNSRFAIYTYIL